MSGSPASRLQSVGDRASENRLQKLRSRIHRSRFPDPVQRAAQDFIYGDLKRVDERIGEFSRQDAAVRRQVIMELRKRVDALGPGRAAPAWSSLIQAAVAAVTILGALVLAIFNGWFSAVVKMTDEKTGLVRGLTEKQFYDSFVAILTSILLLIVVLILIVIWTLKAASDTDKSRGIANAWLSAFSESEAETAERDVEVSRPTDSEVFWERVRRTEL